MEELTHFDANGAAHMVDVSEKPHTKRVATAAAWIKMNLQTYNKVIKGSVKKGDVMSVARLAGIMGAKRTHELIPLCHPLSISKVTLDLTPDPDLPGIGIQATVKTTGQTGVEMEALTAASIAALTVYDMVKAADKSMEVGGLRVLLKDGGKSGRYEAS